MIGKTKYYSILLLLCFAASTMFAQNDLLKTANKNYEFGNFKAAISSYKSLLKSNPNNQEVLAKLGDCYRHINKPERAADYYSKIAVKSGTPSIHLLNYGKVLMQLEQYDEAKNWFKLYAKKDPTTGNQFIKSCDFAKKQKIATALFKPQKEFMNTRDADFAPTFFGTKIIYASCRTDIKNGLNDGGTDWTGEPKNQLFITQQDRKGKLQKAGLLKKSFLAKSNEGPLSFTANRKRVVYTKNNFINGVRQLATSGMKLKLYIADLKSQAEWEKVKPFPFNAKDGEQFSTGYPFISPDGKTLYFASDRPGGMGGFDLYVSKYVNGKWSQPQNLGSQVNTAGDEIAPFLDGQTMYFSSNWHTGFGGYDIFRASATKGRWGKTTNVGKGVNSSRDDIGFIYNKAKNIGYYSSNRLGGKGNEDIYSVIANAGASMPPLVVYGDAGGGKQPPRKPKVPKNYNNKEQIIELSILNKEDKTPVVGAIVDFSYCDSQKFVTDNSGVYKFKSVGFMDCKVTITKEGYEAKTVRLLTRNGNNRIMEVFLTEIDKKFYGLVVDDHSNKPIANVKVIATKKSGEQTISAMTNAGGRYGLHLDLNASYFIKYSKLDYRTTTITKKSGDGSNKNILGVQHLQLSDPSKPARNVDHAGNDQPGGGREPGDIVTPTPPTTPYDQPTDEPKTNYPNIAYEVKIGAFKSANPTELVKLNRYGNVYSEPAGQYKRYKVGAFKTLAEAERVRARIIRETGLYKDAQITKTTNSQLIAEVLVTSPKTESTMPTPPGGRDKDKFNPEPNPYDAPNVMVYKVQLGAYSNPKYFDQKKVEGLGRIETNSKQLANGKQLTIFMLGNFPTKIAAEQARKQVLQRGIPNPFVVAYKNGERVK